MTVFGGRDAADDMENTGLPRNLVLSQPRGPAGGLSARLAPGADTFLGVTFNQDAEKEGDMTKRLPKFAEYFVPQPEEFWRLMPQIGVEHAISELDRESDIHEGSGDMPWDFVPLARMQERYAGYGLTVAGLEDFPPMDRLRTGRPGRHEEMENVLTLIRNMGRLGIPVLCYSWMAGPNWTRTRTQVKTRGGAFVTGFRASDWGQAGVTALGSISADRLWDAFTWFIERAAPAAEEAGVKLALHPDDPPIPELRGVARIMIEVEAFERVFEIEDRQSNSLCLCQGNFALMTDDLPGTIRSLGSSGRIAMGHFRDVEGEADDFVETFHDAGPTDMFACMKAWTEIPFDGVIRPDHVPTLAGEDGARPGYANLARLQAIGYMQGLRDAVLSTKGS
jgi:mannonate dehydratase